MKLRPILLAAVAALLALPSPAAGRDEKPESFETRRDAAIARAFAWLDSNLTAIPDTQGTPRKPFAYATAGLDYLVRGSEGETRTGRDPIPAIRKHLLGYLKEVERRVKDPSELPDAHGLARSDKLCQYTWPLAQSALFFAEMSLRGRYREPSLKAIRRIVAILEYSRAANGGWGHGRINPNPKKEREDPLGGRFKGMSSGYAETLVSTTNTVATALAVVERCFGPGEVEGLDLTREYYRKARLPCGNFPYDPSQRRAGRDKTGVSRTGGALLAMYWLGFPRDDPDFTAAHDFLFEEFPYVSEAHGSPALNLFQTGIALYLLGDDDWKRFRETFLPRIIDGQTEDGDLTCICEEKAFGTTCDNRQAASFALIARGQQAYITSLSLFLLLLDRGREARIFATPPTPTTPPSRAVPTERPKSSPR